MLKISKSNGKPAEIWGVDYMLTSPTMSRLSAYKEGIKKDEFKASQDLLVDCGVPEDVAKKLNADEFQQIVDYITGDKKK